MAHGEEINSTSHLETRVPVKIDDQRSRDRICLGHEYMICFTLLREQSTNMGCIQGFLHWIVTERHAADFYKLLTEGEAYFKACPHECDINND
uniref:Uncharacterized protein n=1 Tax=Romanomermis culicivorax TaxID=13658 RepID=A0A915K720_ROMCU